MVWAIKVILAVLHASGCSTICSHIFFHHIKCRDFCTIWKSSKWTSLVPRTWNYHSWYLDLAIVMAQHDVTRMLGHYFLRNFYSISKPFGINMSAISPMSTAEAFHATVGCPSLFEAEIFCPKKFDKSLTSSNLDAPCFFFLFFFGPTMKVAGKFHLLDFFLVSIPANTVG